MKKDTHILLTGITGFLGSHTAIQCLNKGYHVVGTLRNQNRSDEIREVIVKHTENIKNLRLIEADLSDSIVWDNIMKGIDCVMHIASPFPRELPKHEDDLIIPAKNGVLNILNAAASNGVKRVVMTSSTAAIIYGKEKENRNGTFNENDWNNPKIKKDNTPYYKSKTIAEKAAWNFIKNNSSGMELVTICPGAILGPVLEKDYGTSANIVIKMLDGSVPAIPNIGLEMVDVRSVAELHIKAMEIPEAAGERFVATAGFLSFSEVANILRKKYPNRKIPKNRLPNFAVYIFAQFEKTLKPILLDLGVERKIDNSKPLNLLGWEPLSLEEAVTSCAESLFKQNIIS